MALWRLYYHIVWGTKNRLPLITEDIESRLHEYMAVKSEELKTIIHAINGTHNHVHLIVSIPPVLSISDFVKKIKGSSSHFVNHQLNNYNQIFGWQAGYGVFSFGSKQLNDAVNYVKRQKEHHSAGTIIHSLENIDDEHLSP